MRASEIVDKAGLRAPVIYGGVEHMPYILETVGIVSAFIGYNNDGWLDIVLLTGSRLDRAPRGAINRLMIANYPKRNLRLGHYCREHRGSVRIGQPM